MWRNLFEKKILPLTGAPAVRRVKSYSAESGFVYQYFHAGQRPFHRNGESGTEFVFSVSADRKKWHSVSVLLAEGAVRAWEQAHGRTLTSTECYAVSKMALFQAFDERAAPALMQQDVRVRAADVEGLIETLGL